MRRVARGASQVQILPGGPPLQLYRQPSIFGVAAVLLIQVMETRPVITCFDLARQVGVATGQVGSRPKLETWILDAEARPEKLLQLDDLLLRHFDRQRIDYAYYEAPLPIAVLMGIGAREWTIQLLRSAVAVLEQRCARHKIPVAGWNVQVARRAVIGTGRFKRGTAKRHVMAYARVLGYAPADDNQADALIGFLYQAALLNPRLSYKSTPLFAGAAGP